MSASYGPPPPVPRLAPTDVVACERLRCRLSAAACVARQSALRYGYGYADEVPAYPMCAQGRCAQGAEVRRRLPDDFVPAVFRENRGDLAEQQRARRAWEESRRDRIPSLDAPPPAETDGDRHARAAPARTPLAQAVGREGTRAKGAAMKRPAAPKKRCAGCAKPLRASSKGDLCYRCHVKAGHAVPGRPDLTCIPGVKPSSGSLPDPRELPAEYLERCVALGLALRAGTAPADARVAPREEATHADPVCVVLGTSSRLAECTADHAATLTWSEPMRARRGPLSSQ